MRSKLHVFGHAVHPMLVDFPTAIFPLLAAADILHHLTGEPFLAQGAWWLAVAGLATALAAFATGLFDLAAIPNATRAHKVALLHFLGALVVIGLYGLLVWLRWGGTPPSGLETGLSVAGLVAVVVQGFLGGELLGRHHVGVLDVTEGADPVVLRGKA